MSLRKKFGATLAAAGIIAGSALIAAPTAGADTPGETSLASVLTANGGGTFDDKPYDFDIVTQAVLAVLGAKPDSPVGVLADGSVPLTAFIPNDRAFQVLVWDLTGKWYGGLFGIDEQKVFDAVASLGIDVVETVLLYHVVPGATIDSATAVSVPRGTPLTTAQGGEIRVNPIVPFFKWVSLGDNDRNDADPFLVPSKLDINKGNQQIAHGIGLVLRPLDVEALLAG
jgi:hypothetical protein